MKSTLLETHAPKQEEGGGGGSGDWLQENKPKETTPTSVQNNLELSLGIPLTTTTTTSSSRDVIMSMSAASGGRFMTTLDGLVLSGLQAGTRRPWFTDAAPSCSVAAGFIHPWSLAARQQKAVFEQAHQRSNPSSSTPAVPRFTAPTPPPIVGWPPVRASRKNLVSPVKPEMDGEKEAKRAKMTAEDDDDDGEKMKMLDDVRPPAAMFVKVNMEGFAVGRKINLKAHDSYDSLSRALQKMFTNFLSINYSNSAQEEQDEDPNSDYILLYEDNEGDRMLVGDVPWELFITSVKRLYIAHSPKTPKCDDEKATDEQN